MPVVLVTGGARGIGRALVEAFAADHDVAFTYRNTPPEDVLAQHPDALALQVDLTLAGRAAEVIDRVVSHFGGIDILINNAAEVVSDRVEAFDFDASVSTFALNTSAPMALASAALPHFGAGASIINITSTNARLPAMGAHSYSASKAALETWTKIAAKTLGAQGIRVNAVAPGAVNIAEDPRPDDLTALFVKDTALGALATPQDIASAVRFLASDRARAITGHVLDVNGGYRL